MPFLSVLDATVDFIVLLGLLLHLLLISDTLFGIILNTTVNYFRHWFSPKEMRWLVPFLQSAFASTKQPFLVTCLISQIKSFFCWASINLLVLTLPIINCACKQVKKSCSIDERSVPSRLTCVRYLQIANERGIIIDPLPYIVK